MDEQEVRRDEEDECPHTDTRTVLLKSKIVRVCKKCGKRLETVSGDLLEKVVSPDVEEF